MIKANDLRIGNMVTDQFYDSFKKVITVESVNEKGINLEIEDDGNYPELSSNWIEPEHRFDTLFGIPLTPEILEKVGFEKSDSGVKGWYFYNLILAQSRYGEADLILQYCNSDTLCEVQLLPYENKKYKYLHEIQNLIHTLTGEELQIDLKDFVTIK